MEAPITRPDTRKLPRTTSMKLQLAFAALALLVLVAKPLGRLLLPYFGACTQGRVMVYEARVFNRSREYEVQYVINGTLYRTSTPIREKRKIGVEVCVAYLPFFPGAASSQKADFPAECGCR